MAPRRNAQSTVAEIALVHLQSCLVNLPNSLASLLANLNTVSLFSLYDVLWIVLPACV